MQRKREHDVTKKEVQPDNELLLWEKWIKIRKEETVNLGNQLKKPPVDLAMNLLETIREDNERKTALEYAQIDKKPSIRETLWEQPERLYQECYCQPVYEIHRKPFELGRPPVIEHVAVPEYIKNAEKGLTGVPKRVPCSKLNADYFKYREKREGELKEKIMKIDPFRPSASGLIVKGTKPKTPPKKMPPIPTISVIAPCESFEDVLCGVYAIRINNTVIYKEIPGQSLAHIEKMKQQPWYKPCTNWTYYFNVPAKRAGRGKLFLSNLGTVTVRYCWKKIKRPIPFIPEDIYEQVFFFNKNEDVLSPGQSREIYFTFISDRPGIYNEFWELSFCNICFFDTLSEKFIVNLTADSVENIESTRRKIEILKTRINRKAVNNIVKDLLNEAVEKATTVEPQAYPYKSMLLEAEMFVMKNPVCFYHQTEVLKMKELYTEMVPGELWDLSITQWREMMMEKEFEERMKYYELLRRSHAEFLKPWYEGDGLLKQKYRIMKVFLGQMADKFDEDRDRLLEIYGGSNLQVDSNTATRAESSLSLDPHVTQVILNQFYIHAYEHVATTIELCAGVLSSLDRNRWIEFDFCRW